MPSPSKGSDHSIGVQSLLEEKYFRPLKNPLNQDKIIKTFLPINSIYQYKETDTLLKSNE